MHDTVTRFMGLIVIAMRVQSALSGMRSFMVSQIMRHHGVAAARW